MRTIRLKYVPLIMLFIVAGAFGQTKKFNKTYSTSADVEVEIDAKHTNVIIENWDKNEVAIDAFLETGDNSKVTEEMLKAWKLETTADRKSIRIKSGGGMNIDLNLDGLKEPLSMLPQMLEPLMEGLTPLLSSIAENPLPEGFAEDMGDLNFDYEAYKKDGDKYMEKWEANFEKKFEKKYGKDFERKMEKWAAEMEKNSEKFEKEYEVKMEAWGKDFEKKMEAWGEDFGKKMEAWGEEFGKQFEENMEQNGDMMFNFDSEMANFPSKSKRTIRIKIPKDAKLQLNVRHGELKLGSTVNNLKADLSHSRFSANRVIGKNTNVKAAYTPVKVNTWEYGVLETDFVKNCNIDRAVSIKLNSNSSDVVIKRLDKTGVLSGSFGRLEVLEVGSGFENLNISLENSDLKLKVPQTAFNFNYNGTQSEINVPKSFQLKSTKSYDNEILNGFHKSREGSGNITIKANFSDVLVN